MSDFKKVFSNTGNKSVVLVNRDSDPSMWILNVYKNILFFKKKIESYWFNGREDAERFAEEYLKKS